MDYMPKILFSLYVSIFVNAFVFLSIKNPEIRVSFLAFIGAGISFLIIQIFSFFIKKLLERQLKHSDFVFIRKIFRVFLPYFIFMFCALIFLMFKVLTHTNLDEPEPIGLGVFFICVLFVSFRSDSIKKKLINLQHEKFD